MKVKKFTAATLKEALFQIRKDLGDDALIISSREMSAPLGRKFIEVTAAAEDIKKQEVNDKSEAQRITRLETPDLKEQIIKNRVLMSESLKPLKNELFQIRTTMADIRRSGVATSDLEPIREEVRILKRLLTSMGQQTNTANLPNLPKPLHDIYHTLIASELDETISYTLVEMLDEQLSPEEKADQTATRIKLRELILNSIEPAKPIILNQNQPKIMAFIGPTGVGKTTTIAKLAARCSLQMKKKVCLITIDTYRIAAVEQLKTYAKIMNLPIFVCYKARELHRTIQENSDCSLILIDTAGHSQTDIEQINDLKSFFSGQNDIEVLLVLSATTKSTDLRDITMRFSVIGASKLVFTKLDETTTFGPLLNETIRTKLPVGFFTNGQNVPDDIETATPAKMVNLLIGEAKSR